MKVWLDDVRDPPDDSWTVVRNGVECIDLLLSGSVNQVSLDHDLGNEGDGYYTPHVLNGYDIAFFIEQEMASEHPRFKMPKWECHSANPVGKLRIMAAMVSAENISKDTKKES